MDKELTKRVAAIVADWYDKHAREYLVRYSPESVPDLTAQRKRLDFWLERPETTHVCMLGVSRIGKSTLLNALVDPSQIVAPAGGVGPLTALATEVHYSEQKSLKAAYQPMGELFKVAWGLDRRLQAQKGQANTAALGDLELDEETRREVDEREKEEAEAPDQKEADEQRKREESLRAARLIVAGGQNEERSLEYLTDGLLVACGKSPRWGTTLSPDDAKRVERVSKALRDKRYECDVDSDRAAFVIGLNEHAAGFLSPLIERLEIGWPSPILNGGLILVDLPGVGVAKDVYKAETRRFVDKKARAVIVVVDSAGPTESVMDMLQSTGYWSRLLLASEDPLADPCQLIIVATKVDDLANEEWQQTLPDGEGKRPRKRDVFESIKLRLASSMRQQFAKLLDDIVVTEGSASIGEAREIARQGLMNSLEIFPVSAPEYRRVLANDDEDPSTLRLSDAEESGVPVLARALKKLAHDQAQAKWSRIEEVTRLFLRGIDTHLEVVEQQWKGVDRAADEANRLREALDKKLQGLRDEYNARRASFRTFLGETVPQKIETSVLEAKDDARKKVKQYLDRLSDAHWATLRAAVKRGGTFYGARAIDLPGDIATRFQDPIAAVWSQTLLKDIRQRTYMLAKDINQIVDDLCVWAEKDADAFIDPKVIALQRTLVSSQAEQLREVGREAIEELRDRIKDKVLKKTEKPIRDACEVFVANGGANGPGTKKKILALFNELSETAVDAASVPARATLKDNYQEVREEIVEAFKRWDKPLDRTADALVERHEERMRRSDTQKRAQALTGLAEVRLTRPST